MKLHRMSNSLSCCNQNSQFLLLNCIRTGQDYNEWVNWSSGPEKLEMIEFESKEEDDKMQYLSELVVDGYMKEQEGIPIQLIPTVYLLKIIATYYRAPTARYRLVWGHDIGATPDWNQVSDDETPDWIERER